MSTVDLTSPFGVGRRLSGSSSKVSLRDEDMESLDFNINDISRASSPASISAKSDGHHQHRDRRHRHSFRGDEDYRRRYVRLKSELDAERDKVRSMNKDKIEEMRQIREYYEKERQREHAAMQKRFEDARRKEVSRLKEDMIKQKDYELQQVLKYKEDEIRLYRSHTPGALSERSRTPGAGRTTPGFETPRTPRLADRPLSPPESKDGGRTAGRQSPGLLDSLADELSKTSRSVKEDRADTARSLGRQTPDLDSITDEVIRSRTGRGAGVPSRAVPGERARTPSERARTPGGGRMTPMLSREEDRLTLSLKDTQSKVQALEEEILRLTKQRDELRSKYKLRCQSEEKKDKELLRLKEEYDAELRRVIGEYKKVALGNLQKLKIAEHALREGSMSEDDVLHIPLANPQDLQIRRMSASSQDGGATATAAAHVPRAASATAGIEFGDDGSKREERDKEKMLQKKLGELQTQTQRLERRIMLLRTENEALKKKQEDHKPLEEKIKVLKKRNAELAAIARRLEEKAKALQQENAKNKARTREEGASSDGEHMKRVFARQRAKDLAEHAKNMLGKDREIEDLRLKCQELADQLSNGDVMAPENVQIYEEKEELVNIVKQAAKERLQLEEQLAHSKTKEKTSGDDQERDKQKKELEAANDILHKQIEKLEEALGQTKGIKEELSQKSSECETLTSNLVRLKEQQSELEEELQTSSSKNAQLAVQVAALEEQLQDFEQVNEECSTLRVTLAAAQTEREGAKEQVSALQTRVNSLENLVKELQGSADQLRNLEHEYKEAVSQLAAKQKQIDQLHEAQEKDKAEHNESLTELQTKIKELEKKCQLQETRQEELNTEVQTLREQKVAQDFLHQQKQSAAAAAATGASSRRHGSPVTPGGIPPSDSADSGLPASGANSDEGVSHCGPGKGAETVLDTSNAPDSSTKSHDTGFGDEDSSSQIEPSDHPRPNKQTNHNDHSGGGCSGSGGGGNQRRKAKNPRLQDCGDPELNEIADKLRLLVAADSDDDGDGDVEEEEEEDDDDDSLEEPEDSGMDSHKEARTDLVPQNDSRLSALAMRGPIQVYVAKYSYNPFEYSPNENPEAELQLDAGDYVLVLGDMDEDGFFEGELIDGKRGLVPSNFIERVAEEDLGDFHAALALSGGHDDSNNSAKPGGPSPLDSDNEDMAVEKFGVNGQLNKNILNNNNNAYDAPQPQQLVLERQLTNSVLISWRPPLSLDPGSIQAYHVYVDGALKATLKGSERTKALLEDVDATQNHRVSVRCLSNQGQSKDSQCTMLIGRDVLPVPSDLGMRNVTQNSACIHWTPGNSNCPHALLLNGRELKVVKPGVCQHTLTGLAPCTVYRVTIATKPVSGTYGERHKWSQDKVSCNIEFKTLAGGGVPDPPLNVQLESGPREGTLLLTWLPVTINSSGFSNGAVVTGYVIYADGKIIKEAKGPTNDHMVLSGEDFKGYVPKQLTVRTATVDHMESVDSVAVRLPHSLMKEVAVGTAHSMATEAMRAANHRKVTAGVSDHPAGHETDEEIEAAFQEAEHSSPESERQIAEPFAESSSSELSDILEVEEEMGGDESNQNGDTSMPNSHSQEKIRKSPKAAPRKLSPSPAQQAAEKEPNFTPKKFHGQKPDPTRKDSFLTTPMIVPAIEITRDSSTERGPSSFDDDAEASSSPRPSSSAEPSSKRQQHRQQSVEDGIEKPMPPHDAITQRYRSSSNEPSAFRSVEQGKQRNTAPSTRSPDSTHQGEGTKSPSRSAPGSAHSTPSHKAKEDQRSRSDDKHRASESSTPPRKPSRRIPLESEEVNDRDSITDEIMSRVIDDSTVRLFIALFDYDPLTMSPNQDCVEEELPFREGQILKVFGEKDDDGFFKGEADGREGYIPCNMVSEIHIDDPELVEQLLKENQTSSQHKSSSDRKGKGEGHLTSNGVAPLPSQGPVRRMVALYDYDPQELSPNVDAEVELPFKQGDILYIFGDIDEDGFFSGELNGVRGLVPSNFLQDAPLSDEDEVLESASMVSPSRSQGSISAASRRSDSLSTLNNAPRKDRLSLLPPTAERTIVLDAPTDTHTDVHSSAGSGQEEEKSKKKSGGIFSKVFKKFTR